MIEVINSGNFSVQLCKESLERIQTCTGFETVPLRYRCSSLPIDLTANWKLVGTLATAGTDSRSRGTRHDIRGVDCAGSRNENPLYINSFTNKETFVIR